MMANLIGETHEGFTFFALRPIRYKPYLYASLQIQKYDKLR